MARAYLGWILLLGACLRTPHLIRRPLWQDEALQHDLSVAGGIPQVIHAVARHDLHPPAYSALLSLLSTLPPWALRLPSWIAGMGTIWLAHRLGEALGGHKGARSAALLAAVMPVWVSYSREARPYAVSMFLLMAIYVLLAEDADRPWLHICTAVLCGVWQYMLSLLALIPLAMAFWRDPSRWKWPFAACGFTAATQAALFLPAQWPRAGDLGTRLDPSMGMDSFAFGLPALFGYSLLGVTSAWCIPIGAAVIGWTFFHRRSTHQALRWAWGSLLIAAMLGAMGLHPFGAARPCLPLTIPVFVVLWAPYMRQRVSFQWAAAIALASLAWGRFPGVPVEDVPGVLTALEGRDGPFFAHASASRALAIYAPDFEVQRVVPWGCVALDLPVERGWLIASGAAPCLAPWVEGLAEAPWSEPFTGVRVYATPLNAQP